MGRYLELLNSKIINETLDVGKIIMNIDHYYKNNNVEKEVCRIILVNGANMLISDVDLYEVYVGLGKPEVNVRVSGNPQYSTAPLLKGTKALEYLNWN